MPFSFRKLKFQTFRSRNRIGTTEDSCSRTRSSRSFSRKSSITRTCNKTSSALARLGRKSILVLPRLMIPSITPNQARPPAAPVRALHRPVDLDSLPRTDSNATRTFKMMCKSYGLKRKSASPIIPDLESLEKMDNSCVCDYNL